MCRGLVLRLPPLAWLLGSTLVVCCTLSSPFLLELEVHAGSSCEHVTFSVPVSVEASQCCAADDSSAGLSGAVVSCCLGHAAPPALPATA
jgi:hypothetical protein